MTDTFGKIFRLTDGGDTHGLAMEGLIEGCPPQVCLDYDFIERELARRAPTSDQSSTQRRESDHVRFLSGIIDGITTGETIRFQIPNVDVQSNEVNRHIIKPSHASYTYFKKYGYTDNELCGRASARQTICRVVAGAIAKQILQPYHIAIHAETLYTGDPQREGDTVGAVVRCTIQDVPAGLGEPVYDKFSARLAYAMLSINAAKGFEIGLGYNASRMAGSQYNDLQRSDFSYQTNHDGGVQAGITNGQPIYFTIAFKPIPSVRFEQQTIDFKGNKVLYKGSDRNDLCVVPRVLPVVEAMAAMVTVDFLLLNSITTSYEK